MSSPCCIVWMMPLAFGAQPALAAECTATVVEQLPQTATDALLDIGECALGEEDFDLAIEAYGAAAARGDTLGMAGLAEALGLRDLPVDQPRAIWALLTLLDTLKRDPDRFSTQIAEYSVDLADHQRRAGLDAEAVKSYDNALNFAYRTVDALTPEWTAIALNNKGVSLESLARYAEALSAYEASRAIMLPTSRDESVRQAKLLLNIGVINWKLGDNNNAERDLKDAVHSLGALGETGPLASALNNLGLVLAWRERYDEASTVLKRSLELRAQTFGIASAEVAVSANNLGVALTMAGRYDEAVYPIERAVQIASGGDPNLLAQALDTRAENVLRRGYPLASLSDSLGAIEIWRRDVIANSDDLRQAYERTASILKTEGYSRASTVFAKLGVNAHQQIKQGNQQLVDRLSRKLSWRYNAMYLSLIDTLIASGSFVDARYVADLLKQREFQHFFDSQFVSGAVPHHSMPMTGDETKFEVALIGHRRSALDLKRVATAYEELAAGPAAASAFPDDFVEFAKTHRVAVLQIVAATDTLHLFLTGPNGAIIHKSTSIERSDLARLVHTVSTNSEVGQANAIDQLRMLYNKIIAPLVFDLKATGADTLILNVSGFLRYVPFAALYSGERYLIEDYALAYRTPAAELQPTRIAPRASGVGFGMTQAVTGFPALTGAGREIEALFNGNDHVGVIEGPAHLDDEFTASALTEALSGRPSYLHIASHFRFRSDDPGQSFLLLGDATGLTLERLRQDDRFRFNGVDLVVLSACETGRDGGDGADVESLGVAAQLNGAASVMATLWPISDSATVDLMTNFYKGITQRHLSKAKALQAAQVIALRNSVPSPNLSVRGARPLDQSAPSRVHPMYWAPFILMGDWR